MNKRLVILFIMILVSEIAYSKNKLPYKVSYDLEYKDKNENQIVEIGINLTNKSSKSISAFTIVFYLFDYEGNSAIKEKNSIVLRFDEEINAHDSISINKDISQFITEDYETGLEVECLYVSIIEYEDGILWTDPFGIKKF